MDITSFKTKHQDLINKGIITFTNVHPYFDEILNRVTHTPEEVEEYRKVLSGEYIIIDRKFLVENKELNSPRYDIKKMGYRKDNGMGVFKYDISPCDHVLRPHKITDSGRVYCGYCRKEIRVQ